MKYDHYTVEDLAADPHFRQWVVSPTPELTEFWDEWICGHPDRHERADEARELVLVLQSDAVEVPPVQVQRAWERLDRQLTQQEGAARQRRLHWYRWAAAACLVLGVVGGGWIWWQNTPLSYTTAYGETREVVLPDGSRVVLNANSTLRLQGSWATSAWTRGTDTDREVWLEGEAFFNVCRQHVDHQPVKFRVYTPDLTIEVLGTQFNVTNRDEATQVVLKSGKVRLALRNEQDEEIMMQPGDLVAYSRAEHHLKQRVVVPERYEAWTEGKLVLDDVTLQTVADEIEAIYGIEVVIKDDSLKAMKLGGTLYTENLNQLLDALVFTTGVQVQHHDHQILIRK
ncbi:ferric-dicitrate binding protein FerR, regulates iron transport through sigma-19 [Catalinimonas alkaloidigena]|uniref:Ferric-dicitrate binding protein FerR, regulates iron transport through sigma-19 n=1 Tax=Catalinimonas alkaloidigena TaxID=1075417 RepID=A0A1G9NI93_9BACT|nr:FecR domain-containing protein [Catalinimonas alkaloidigena]SDL86053.1 ferric-dicitrate binding protein FerR, regulates iron transport through sigma-19 [Catalinimonas alkaloidigena]